MSIVNNNRLNQLEASYEALEKKILEAIESINERLVVLEQKQEEQPKRGRTTNTKP